MGLGFKVRDRLGIKFRVRVRFGVNFRVSVKVKVSIIGLGLVRVMSVKSLGVRVKVKI